MSTANIHNNNIRSDLLDIPVGNAIIRFIIKEVAEFIATGYDHFTYLTAALIKFKIADSSELFAIPQIDHILGFQFRKTHFFPLSFSLSS